MKFKLAPGDDAQVYDVDLAMAKVNLNILFELKTKHGISAKDLQGMAKYLEKYNGKPPEELLDDKVALRAFMVVLWLTRRYYGDKGPGGGRITLEEANDFALDTFFILPEEQPAAEAEGDPKATPASEVDSKEPGSTTPTT